MNGEPATLIGSGKRAAIATVLSVTRTSRGGCGTTANSIRHQKRPAIPKHTRQIILNRDSWRCYLCEQFIPQNVAWPHPLSGTVDHVIPWIAGGTGRRENLRAAHWSCNRRKAASLLEVA